MKDLSIQEIWQQNELLLDSTRKLNVSLLKEIKLDKARASLKRLLFLPISTLVFYLLIASYALYFVMVHAEKWYFVFSGAVVVLFSLMLVVTSIQQLKRILSVNYEAPVLQLQRDVVKIKTAVISNFRIGAWLLPFGPFVGLFVVKALFGFDLVELINFNMIISFGFVTILLEILSLLLLRALRPKNINKKWLNWLLQGSGSQVDEALGFLQQIETFEQESHESTFE